MKPITSPIKLNDTGAAVKDLHNALLSIAMNSGGRFAHLLKDPKFLRQWTIEFNSATFGEATAQAVALLQQQAGLKQTGKVNKNTAAAINVLLGANAQPPSDPDAPLKVYGTVYDEWIEPLKAAPVMIFDKDIRSEHRLAEGETDDKGNYSLTYSRHKLTRQDAGGANLVVKVYGDDGDPIYTSPVNYSATAQLQVNVNLGPRAYMGPSAFVKNVQLIKPFIGDIPIGDLTENTKVHDLSFLISKTGIATATLLQLVAAFRFEKWTKVAAEVYYGILKLSASKLPTDVDTTIEQAYINFWNATVTTMMSTLQQSAINNIVTYALLKHSDEIQTALQKLQTAPPQDSGATQPLPPVYSNINTAGLNAAQQQDFLNLYSSTAMSPSFWTTLAQDKSFQGATAVINKLQVVYQVAAWTTNNTSLTSAIIQQFSINSAQDIAKLVTNNVSDWVTFINNSNTVPAGTSQAATVQALAATIATNVERLYPTQVLADRFSKNTTLQLPNQSVITNILSNTAFDITKSVPSFIRQNPLPAGSDTKAITNQVLGIQRTNKVTASADNTLILLADNIQSARQIYAMGKDNFVSTYSASIGSTSSEAIYDNAAAIHAGATSLMGQLVSRVNNPATRVFANYNNQLPTSTLMNDYPDLANLFGIAASYCECTDCESFLGIPAYLADLLDFLYQRTTASGSAVPNARAALLANSYTFSDGMISNALWHRRPDIGDIDMNCNNTNTELPYIDIVNELLEDYIIPPVAGIKVAMPGKDGLIYFIYWLLYYLKAGTINPYLWNKIVTIIGNDPKTPICNISLLTKQAVVSDVFFSDGENLPEWVGPPLVDVNPYGPLFAQWMIRDQYITLKVNLMFGEYVLRDKGQLFPNAALTKFPLDIAALEKDSALTDAAVLYYTALTKSSDNYTFASVNEGGGNEENEKYFYLVIQEVHQTHLTTDEINANPEYTNTNVYNSLSDPFDDNGNNKWGLYQLDGGMIPISLPFDLYFTEANTYLQKIGVQRYSLIDTFRRQDGSSLDSEVIAYMGLSTGDEDIIFTPRFTANINAGAAGDPQLQFWGQLLDGSGNVPVAPFLAESGLDFQQLQTLLTVIFINPPGANNSYIADAGTTTITVAGKPGITIYDPCNIGELVIANVTSQKMDAINRFVRLWNKLNILTTISMHELDLCINCTSIGSGALNMPFAEQLFYFLQLMNQLSLSATQTIVLYQDIDTFTDIYDSTFVNLYQQLFQNRQISNPLVPAFTLPITIPYPITDTTHNAGAVPVILTACQITQADLTNILNLTYPPNPNTPYTNLTLDNLSFIYAGGILSNALSIPVADVLTFMTLTGMTPMNPVDPTTLLRTNVCSPVNTFNFIAQFNEIQQAGFTVDGINYLLTNQSTANPSLIPNSATVISGLGDIRTAIQAAITATTPVADPKGVLLKQWLADPDLNWAPTVAAKLLSILATSGNASYNAAVQNNLRFLQLLQVQYQESGASAYLQQLPALSFPDPTISRIKYDNIQCYLFYDGKMSSEQYNTLSALLPSDATTQAALTSLYQQSQECALSAALWQAVPPSPAPAWLAVAQTTIPDFSIGEGVLNFTGPMTAATYLALLTQSNIASYNCALTQLFISTNSSAAGPTTYVQLAALPGITLPDADAISLSYRLDPVTSVPELAFTGAMSAADALALLGLANTMSAADALNWKTAITTLYTSALAGQTVSVPYPPPPATLPAGWNSLPGNFPDLSGIDGLSFSPGSSGSSAIPPALLYTGQMNTYVQAALTNLSNAAGWAANITALYTNSQSTIAATAPVAVGLVFTPTAAQLTTFGLTFTAPAGTTPGSLGYTGVMSDYILNLLLALPTTPDPIWAAAVNTLYQNALGSLVTAVQVTLPGGVTIPAATGVTTTPAATPGVSILTTTGPLSPTVQQQLSALSTDPGYQAAIGYLVAQTSAIITAALPTIQLPLPDNNISTTAYSTGYIQFTGTPNPDCMDEFNLQLLSDDPGYGDAISWIYSTPVPAAGSGYVAAVLEALPSIVFPMTIPISWSDGQLGITGQMTSANLTTLQGLSTDPNYRSALTALYQASQLTLPAETTILSTVPLASLPVITLPAIVTYDNIDHVLYYTGNVQLPAATATTLTGLSTDPYYTAAVGLIAGIAPVANAYLIYAPAPETSFSTVTLAAAATSTINYFGGTLSIGGALSFPDYLGLLALSADPDYTAAVNQLYTGSGTAPYFPLPSISIPPLYASQLSFNAATSTLTLVGYISAADQSALLSFSTDTDWIQAIDTLYSTVNDPLLPAPDFFAGLVETLLPAASTAAATSSASAANTAPAAATLYAFFLDQLSPIYQPIKEAEALETQLAGTFGISVAIAAVLVVSLPDLFDAMTDPGFATNNRPINPDPNQFPPAQWYMLLTRMAFLITQFNLGAADVDWLLQNAGAVNAIDMTAYPTATAPLAFSAWEVLNNLCIFNRTYKPQTITDPADPGDTITLSVYTIITAASDLTTAANPNPGLLLSQLVQLTGWTLSELQYLLHIGPLPLPNLPANPLLLIDSGTSMGCAIDLDDISVLLRLSACFNIAKQMKVVPSRCVTWVIDPLTNTTAIDIKQALKSIYPDDASWISAIQPLINTLRQNRRDALLAYLLSNPVKNVFSWPGTFTAFPDEYHAYGNFLIDIEMQACQPTTRTIQAYCSIQLFVQRCLLNIEAPGILADTSNDGDWSQWSWMGTFETWYEARYYFLYPENFILPQTLPNQSSFFQDMQNNLAQGPVTTAIVETAYGSYLQSLDQVARLEVKGMWYDHPSGVLHVFARTYGGDPAVYYYRTCNNLFQWSPWEIITADINGDEIIPLVQNGRIYLYWPVFTQTTDDNNSPQTIPSSSSGGTAPPPTKYWKIQLAFSEYRNGQWSGKKLSKDYLVSQVILTNAGSPTIFPDTSDFVFLALDIPPQNNSEYLGTMNNMTGNGMMIIAPFQPSQVTITVNVIFNNGYSATCPMQSNAQYDPGFDLSDLYGQINSATGYNLTDNDYTYISVPPDPSSTLVSLINGNGKLPHGVKVSYLTTTFSYSGNTGGLSYLNYPADYNLGDYNNCFLLDPQRGYPSAYDFGDFLYDETLSPNWFTNSSFDNMLDDGSTPLYTGSNSAILNPSNGMNYSNLLPLQTGIWADYTYLTTIDTLENLNWLNQIGALMPFFYQDTARTFFVLQSLYTNGVYCYYPDMIGMFAATDGGNSQLNAFFGLASNPGMDSGPLYQFINFYHPFAHQFIKIFGNPAQGIEYILPRSIQLTGDPVLNPSLVPYGLTAEAQQNLITNNQTGNSATYQQPFNFVNTYGPSTTTVNQDATYGTPIEEIDFGPSYTLMGTLSGYGQYNWELFFHTVLMSAIQLSQNQQFADADTWFKFIFNPTDTSGNPSPQKYWVTKPFFENMTSTLTIDDLILLYELDPSLVTPFWNSVNLWRNDPYDPHMLAQLRLTPYMYTTFMKYLDNLIAWANFNYQQYTMETVNIAIQLFMTALECLGPEPVSIPPAVQTPTQNYYQMELDLEVLSFQEGPEGYLSDPVVQFENVLPPTIPNSNGPDSEQKLITTPGLYFCIPPNPVLLAYWDTINTQLYKIRNCMNIAGQFQPLSPFPNVPGVGNMDGSGVADFGGVLPNYRFSVMIQKATELCNEVKSLGASLLAALEKEDAEALALLHASQEITVQQNIDTIKQMQITDANFGYNNLVAYKALVTDKQTYYADLVSAGLLSLETQALALNQSSLSREDPIVAATMIASVLHAIPNFTLGVSGFGGSPEGCVTLGGQQFGAVADCFVQYMQYESHCDDKNASLNTVNAGYLRRAAEWTFQQGQATDELAQIAVQLQSAQEKINIATQDEQNQQTLISNAETIQTFLQNKYTNQQLYSWMVTQISNVYFQAYQLAYSFAKQAEVCYGYELGITGASYINYGYWDSLHKGLLSGEALMNSLKQMETDYYANDIREYELTRQISLAQLDPAALLQLKANGTCFVNIPEELFDLDYPGQYFRRVKHIAVTIPGVVGPYTPVCLKMTLMSNSVRMVANPTETANSYPRNTDSTGAPTNDSRFLDNYAAIQYIATSNGVNDSGLFEMNLHDERYLPFERAGAISTWQLEFPSAYPQFDPGSITDLIIHFSYTSRDGGPALQAAATASIQSKLGKAMTAPELVLMRGFSARRDFPTQWYQFLNPVSGGPQQLVMDITKRFPFFTQGLTIKITSVMIVADIPATAVNSPNFYLSGTKLSNAPVTFGPDPQYGAMQYSVTGCRDTAGVWNILNSITTSPVGSPLTNGDMTDLYVVFYYSLVKSNG
jgi:hypothetical protein